MFSPSPLTPRMLDNYRLLEDEYRSSLPAIDVARFIQPSDAPPQPHVLKHDQLSWVADFKAQDHTDLQALLDLQPFNNDQIVSPHASRQALAPLVNQSKPSWRRHRPRRRHRHYPGAQRLAQCRCR